MGNTSKIHGEVQVGAAFNIYPVIAEDENGQLSLRDVVTYDLKKIDELQAIVDLYNVSIVCITETWFKEYIGDESASLYGYNLERKDRTHGRAGG